MNPPAHDYREAVRSFKREFLLQMLTAHGGNRTRTARAIGMQRTYLLRLLRGLALKPADQSAHPRNAQDLK